MNISTFIIKFTKDDALRFRVGDQKLLNPQLALFLACACHLFALAKSQQVEQIIFLLLLVQYDHDDGIANTCVQLSDEFCSAVKSGKTKARCCFNMVLV